MQAGDCWKIKGLIYLCRILVDLPAHALHIASDLHWPLCSPLF